MAKRRVSDKSLRNAEKLSELLLYEASGGNLGVKPELVVKQQTMTFGEKCSFLDKLIKIAALKGKAEPEVEKSGLELLAERLNGSPSDGNKRDIKRTDSSVGEPDDTSQPSDDTSADGKEDEEIL